MPSPCPYTTGSRAAPPAAAPRFFIWKGTYIEHLKSSGIMAADPSGVFEGQIKSAPAVASSDSLAEVLNQLRQVNEGIPNINTGLAEARMAYMGVFCTPRITRMIVLSLFYVWLGCTLAKFIQM
ncbi:uncharacterized protein LOC124651457 [Lolium rigidum]|uniref:uncharacterized protein LOC124651457 n=1 Tax=Lolium rigidum TaxID=89674 RepID=UPI001F5E16C7|nr:uncharacterized protein LOC124651457 [Lolium rigidum]